MRVVHVPEREHRCRPGWVEKFHLHNPEQNWPVPSLPTGWYLHQERHRLGTVIECACGLTWVAVPHKYENVLHEVWRRETRRERRRRLKGGRGANAS